MGNNNLQHARTKRLEWALKALEEKQHGRTAYLLECVGQARKWHRTVERLLAGL